MRGRQSGGLFLLVFRVAYGLHSRLCGCGRCCESFGAALLWFAHRVGDGEPWAARRDVGDAVLNRRGRSRQKNNWRGEKRSKSSVTVTAWRGTDDWRNGRVARRMRLKRRELNITRRQPHTNSSNERCSDRAPPAAPPRAPFLFRRLVAESVAPPLPRPLCCSWSVFRRVFPRSGARDGRATNTHSSGCTHATAARRAMGSGRKMMSEPSGSANPMVLTIGGSSHFACRACIHSNDGPCRSILSLSSSSSSDLRHTWLNFVSAGSSGVGGDRLTTMASSKREEKQ